MNQKYKKNSPKLINAYLFTMPCWVVHDIVFSIRDEASKTNPELPFSQYLSKSKNAFQQGCCRWEIIKLNVINNEQANAKMEAFPL